MSEQTIEDIPHRRLNPLTGQWVLVSPHRNKRPWQGRIESTVPPTRPTYDETCYLCPGNTRANGEKNPNYKGTYAFDNDFPALLEEDVGVVGSSEPLFTAVPVRGKARVLCFSERHDLTLAELDPPQIKDVVDLWAHETQTLGARYDWVAVFENKGAMMGCSNPHPHGQIWASDFLPVEVEKEDAGQARYMAEHGSNLLVDYAAREAAEGRRTLAENDDWIVVVPYWATWPYETMVLPKRHILRMPDLSEGERASLADALKQLCVRYDNLFQTEFPYTMGWHGAPFADGDHSHWQLHAHFYPPLLRSATIRKFMVGYEMLSEAQRDLTPELAADHLRAQSLVHYKKEAAS